MQVLVPRVWCMKAKVGSVMETVIKVGFKRDPQAIVMWLNIEDHLGQQQF